MFLPPAQPLGKREGRVLPLGKREGRVLPLGEREAQEDADLL